MVIMKDTWQQALGKMTYGIYVLTASYQDEINGMVASWVSQVSFDPPLVMVAIHPSRYSNRLVTQSGCFALHVLSKNQKDFLTRFKGPDPAAKFSSVQWKKGKTGCPIIEDCIAYLECKVKDSCNPGNHTIFIGEVVHAQFISDKTPLNSADYKGVYFGKS